MRVCNDWVTIETICIDFNVVDHGVRDGLVPVQGQLLIEELFISFPYSVAILPGVPVEFQGEQERNLICNFIAYYGPLLIASEDEKLVLRVIHRSEDRVFLVLHCSYELNVGHF